MSKTLASAFSMLSSAPPAALPENEKSSSKKTPQEGQGKYQLFPKGRQSPSPSNHSSVDPDTAFALALNSNKNTEKLGAIPALKIKLNQQPIVRRRKANNIPDLGPMTTVQEVAMDSPTIPGLPALRERAGSASQDESARDRAGPYKLGKATYTPPKQTDAQRRPVGSQPPRLPSPKRLAPLVIPEPQQLTFLHDVQQPSPPPMLLRTDSAPLLGNDSIPIQYLTPISSSDASRPASSGSVVFNSATTLPTPISASTSDAKSATAKQWEQPSSRSSSHRRFASDSQSAQHRGRTKKRSEQHKKSNSHPTVPHTSSGEKKRSKSAEQRAFEELPSGCRPLQAVSQMSANDLGILRQQALGQAERFEVLQVDDVERLSKELRKLDERVEYLRRTYNSLRNGRRNFHSRICQYLRSPMRGSRLSADSMLRQEEALAELDASIDGWVIKLERAENRRTRVRQKLLEHIAAAAILNVGGETPSPVQPTARPPSTPLRPASPMQARTVQDIATPPRSPDRPASSSRPVSASPPPLRVVAQVPSMILELPAEPVEAQSKTELTRTPTMKSSDGESIRIYAGDELFALLTDVEDEIIRMNNVTPESSSSPESTTAPEFGATPEPIALPAPDRKHTDFLQVGQKQSRSNLRLSAQPDSPTLAAPPLMLKSTFYRPATPNSQPPSPPAPVPPLKDVPKDGEVFLTSAVFKPK
ncbi:hypothetical protein BBK36DRAFT_1165952 [Trichoderma citrinoviride]|uniref:Up-regulated during septation protein 1 domain-containing protein n=1 Tax=Trichoderma citrinoviride TaxID=58853 RepID=A0A2T4BKB8_9HYPO|nr:hypothetical protein BBK36DRAFT_1165952 [Trichoderma citrinoviride]PTB69709.1 hypothetical protein BBK36DRAFT_1165952 [Trichoderma citrinoviride]